MSYNFRDREVADELKRIALHNLGSVTDPRVPTGNEIVIVKAPADGIAAIDGTTITSGTCTRMFVNQGATDVDLSEDISIELEVFNTTSQEIAGDSYFQAARVGTSWISIIGGGSVKTMVTNSAITARSGSTAGTGTAVSYTYDDTTGNYVTGTESPAFNIVNPYVTDVSTSVVIQCHAVGDKWEIIQSECEGV